jgi:hypothetical protein
LWYVCVIDFWSLRATPDSQDSALLTLHCTHFSSKQEQTSYNCLSLTHTHTHIYIIQYIPVFGIRLFLFFFVLQRYSFDMPKARRQRVRRHAVAAGHDESSMVIEEANQTVALASSLMPDLPQVDEKALKAIIAGKSPFAHHVNTDDTETDNAPSDLNADIKSQDPTVTTTVATGLPGNVNLPNHVIRQSKVDKRRQRRNKFMQRMFSC